MLKKTFTDFDAFAESVKDVDARMMFQNPSIHRWSISHTWLSQTHLQLGKLGTGNIVEGQSSFDGLLLYVPISKQCEYRANSTFYDPGSVVVLEPGCEFCVASNAAHDWCTIQIPKEMFADADEKLSTSAKPTCWVRHDNPQAAHQIYRLVRRVLNNAENHPGFENTLAASYIEKDLSRIVAKVLGNTPVKQVSDGREGRPTVPRDEIVRRCKRLMEERYAEPIRVDDLLKVSQVSERTLRRAFNEYYGIGPIRYLQLRQHHRVRRVLSAMDPESTTVTKVLFSNGVANLGRFATTYKNLFGELPSDTLRAKEH